MVPNENIYKYKGLFEVKNKKIIFSICESFKIIIKVNELSAQHIIMLCVR